MRPLHLHGGMAVVAIFNSSDDTVEVLRYALESAGFETVAGHVPDIRRGRLDFIAFIEQHEPAALVYDISLPYEENWTFLKLIRDTAVMQTRPLVLTTTNKNALEQLVGPTDTIEIVGKPYEIDAVIEAVRKALSASPDS